MLSLYWFFSCVQRPLNSEVQHTGRLLRRWIWADNTYVWCGLLSYFASYLPVPQALFQRKCVIACLISQHCNMSPVCNTVTSFAQIRMVRWIELLYCTFLTVIVFEPIGHVVFIRLSHAVRDAVSLLSYISAFPHRDHLQMSLLLRAGTSRKRCFLFSIFNVILAGKHFFFTINQCGVFLEACKMSKKMKKNALF